MTSQDYTHPDDRTLLNDTYTLLCKKEPEQFRAVRFSIYSLLRSGLYNPKDEISEISTCH